MGYLLVRGRHRLSVPGIGHGRAVHRLELALSIAPREHFLFQSRNDALQDPQLFRRGSVLLLQHGTLLVALGYRDTLE